MGKWIGGVHNRRLNGTEIPLQGHNRREGRQGPHLRLGRDTSTCGAGIILDFGGFAKLVQEVDVWRIPERLPCRRATATCKRWPGESRDGSLLPGGPIPGLSLSTAGEASMRVETTIDVVDQKRWYRVGGLAALVLGICYVAIIPLYAHVGVPPNGGGEAWFKYLSGKTTFWWTILGLSVFTDFLFVPVALALYLSLKGVNRNAMLL